MGVTDEMMMQSVIAARASRVRHLPKLWLLAGVMAIPGVGIQAHAISHSSLMLPGKAGVSTNVNDDDLQVAKLEEQAVNAQNAGDFKTAVEFWQQLVDKYPESDRRGEALHNLGLCLSKTGNFTGAIKPLVDAIALLDRQNPKPEQSLARAHLYLGYSQLEAAKQAGPLADDSRTLFTTATQTFGNLLSRYPEYEGRHEAQYFQGVAFENLQMSEKAEAAFRAVCEQKDSPFYGDSLFGLGFAREQLGKFEPALEAYQAYLQLDGQQKADDEVQLRRGEVLMQLAQAAQHRGDEAEDRTFTEQALQAFKLVTDQTESLFRDQALMRAAVVLFQRGDYREAGKQFEAASLIPDSARASRARALAARAYLQADLGSDALRVLELAVKADDENSPESAHWLAQLYLRASQPERAAEVAESWIKRAPDHPFVPELKMDRADAALAKPGNQSAAAALYQEIATSHPQHPVAPTALYHAAFSLLEINQAAEAAELSQKFQTLYPDHMLLPEVQEVYADSLLVQQKYPAAVAVWQTMVSQHAKHNKIEAWQLRLGLSLFFAERFSDAVAILEPLVAATADPVRKGEALHWLGCSNFQLQQNAVAAQQLAQSIGLVPAWKRSPESRLLLLQAQLALNDLSAAEATVKGLVEQHPNAAQTPEALLRIAQRVDGQPAFDALQLIEERYAESPMLPFALTTLGRKFSEAGQWSDAEQRWAQVIEKFADFPNYHQVVIEWSGAARRLKQFEPVVMRLESYQKRLPPESPEALDVGHELSLTQMAAGQYQTALERWQKLVQLPAADRLADQMLYELAWGYRDWAHTASKTDEETVREQRTARSLEFFEQIAKRYPDRAVAADAFYQLGQAAYDRQAFEDAVQWFQRCEQSSHAIDSLREKSLYKLGWCAFRQNKYPQAIEFFRRQVEKYPQGDLLADSMFMQSESLFAQANYRDALVAYRAAKPVLEANDKVAKQNRWLNLLHGAQAAIQENEFETAQSFAKELTEDDQAPAVVRADAQLELGKAELGLKNRESAIAAWTLAAEDLGKTGAQARFLLGQMLFADQKFNEAISEFKKVFYGYGGTQVDSDIDSWQARAVFEAARCYQVQIKTASAEARGSLLNDAIFFFELLKKDYSADPLAKDAEQQLLILRKLK